MVFKVYSDGSGMTGGPAGIGFVAYADGGLLLKGKGAVASATNHQAELRAAVFAHDSIPEGQDIQLLSDSKPPVPTPPAVTAARGHFVLGRRDRSSGAAAKRAGITRNRC